MHRILLLLLNVFIINHCIAQDVPKKKVGDLSVAFDYSTGGEKASNYNFIDQQSFSFDISFYSLKQTNISANYFLLTNSDSVFSSNSGNLSLSINKTFDLNDEWQLSVGADNYIYDKDLNSLSKTYFSVLNTNISWWKQFFMLAAQPTLYIGNAIDFGVTAICAPSYIWIPKKKQNLAISLSLSVSTEFVTRNYINHSYDELINMKFLQAATILPNGNELIEEANENAEEFWISTFPNYNSFTDARKSLLTEIAVPIEFNKLLIDQQASEDYSFALSHTYLSIPLIVNYKQYYFISSFTYYIPSYSSKLYPADKSGFFDVGIIYEFPIKN
jgi:hypothetical protein